MLIERNINGVDVLVDNEMPARIMFKKDDVDRFNIVSGMELKDIEKALKQDSDIVPFELTWELTNRCNLNCPFCYIHNVRKGRDISFDEAKAVIDKVVSMGLIRVTLTGGECTLNKDFLKIYEYFKTKGVIADVYTNGVNIPYEIFEMFKKYPPNRVEITVYNEYEKRPNPYLNLLKLKEMGINVLAKYTVTTTTVMYFERFKLWCEKNQIEYQYDTDIFDFTNPFKVSCYQIDEKSKFDLDKAKYSKFVSTKEITPITCFDCGSGNVFINIDANFNLKYCSKSQEQYSLDEMSFEEAYEKLTCSILKDKGKPIVNCNGCFAKSLCRMCHLKAKKCTDDNGEIMYVVDPNHCKKTQDLYKKIYEKDVLK